MSAVIFLQNPFCPFIFPVPGQLYTIDILYKHPASCSFYTASSFYAARCDQVNLKWAKNRALSLSSSSSYFSRTDDTVDVKTRNMFSASGLIIG